MMKQKFRQSVEWKNFRKEMMVKQNGMDPITHRKLTKHFHCHHQDYNPTNYKNLNPEHFVCLNAQMHKLVHLITNGMKHYGGKEFLDRLLAIIDIDAQINDLY